MEISLKAEALRMRVSCTIRAKTEALFFWNSATLAFPLLSRSVATFEAFSLFQGHRNIASKCVRVQKCGKSEPTFKKSVLFSEASPSCSLEPCTRPVARTSGCRELFRYFGAATGILGNLACHRPMFFSALNPHTPSLFSWLRARALGMKERRRWKFRGNERRNFERRMTKYQWTDRHF